MSQAIKQNVETVSTPSLLKLKALQTAAEKLSDLKSTPQGLGAKDLVGLLICQVQRNKRLAMPRVRIHLRFASCSEKTAVKLRLGASNI